MEIAEAIPVALEEAGARLLERRTKFTTIQKQLETGIQEAEGLKGLREKYLVTASQGDKSAIAHVEEIEGQQRIAGRNVEGLQIRVETARAELQQAESEWKDLATKAATAERDREAERLRLEAGRLMHNQIAHWRAGCRVADELRTLLAGVEDHPGFTARQKSEIHQAAGLLFEAQNPYNEGWKINTRSAGGWRHIIEPKCAPDELRHLEELK